MAMRLIVVWMIMTRIVRMRVRMIFMGMGMGMRVIMIVVMIVQCVMLMPMAVRNFTVVMMPLPKLEPFLDRIAC